MGIIAISGVRESEGSGVSMRLGGVEGLGGCSVGRVEEGWDSVDGLGLDC
jgi:hypothetical protein